MTTQIGKLSQTTLGQFSSQSRSWKTNCSFRLKSQTCTGKIPGESCWWQFQHLSRTTQRLPRAHLPRACISVQDNTVQHQNTNTGAKLMLGETPTKNQWFNPGLSSPFYFRKEKSAKDGMAEEAHRAGRLSSVKIEPEQLAAYIPCFAGETQKRKTIKLSGGKSGFPGSLQPRCNCDQSALASISFPCVFRLTRAACGEQLGQADACLLSLA